MTKIGWFVDSRIPPMELLCEVPEPLEMLKNNNAAYKYCPAVNRYCSNTFVVKSPYSISLAFKKGQIEVVSSSFAPILKDDIILPEKISHWRDPLSPLFQMNIHQGFVADEEVWMEVSMPSLDSKSRSLPGRIIPGEFDIFSWQRIMSYSFEWLNTDEDFILEKGDPLYYVRFRSKKPSDTFQIVRIEETEDLRKAIDRCTDSKLYYVGKAWNLMKINRMLRIKKYIK
jgi:hypothetical protein